jgi:selenide, water dikinase
LQMRGDDDVFAVGDCANVIEHPREKAGVFAVRQGPPLERNLRLRARGEPAVPFHPQTQWLTLLSLGRKSAIAARGPFNGVGRLGVAVEGYHRPPLHGQVRGAARDGGVCARR